MKASRYNFFAKRTDGKITAFNAFSTALGFFSKETYNVYDRIVKGIEVESLTEHQKGILKELKNANFLIPDDLDEIKALQVQMNRRRYESSVLGLTIMPTAECNLNCRYCYEQTSNQRMTSETASKLVDFVRNRLGAVKRFDVTWYGGEPLLEKATIYQLSEEFIKVCEEQNCFFSAGIITNGLLLDSETARRLSKDCNINFCQVTLDGPRHVHDSRRKFKDGTGTFDIILNNIMEASEYLNINIRINIDSENEGNYLELLDELEFLGLKEKVEG